MNKLHSAALCAHIHDAVSFINSETHSWNTKHVNAFVSSVYSSSRCIELCKEIASIAKALIAEEAINVSEFHHLRLNLRTDEVRQSHLYRVEEIDIEGSSYKIINDLIHLPQSSERDKSLILMTKLSSFVLPLKVNEGVKGCRQMLENIMTPFKVPDTLYNQFKEFLYTYNFRKDLERENPKLSDWRKNLLPLHDLAVMYCTSSKKKPSIHSDEEGIVKVDIDDYLKKIHQYDLEFILYNKFLRALYLKYKVDFLTLCTGYPVLEILDDSNLLKEEANIEPIGRQGIRLQEAEKIRTLFMPMIVFASLCRPAVTILEFFVRRSRHQTTYLDDFTAAEKIRHCLFPNNQRSDELIYSIDQSSFTDNFPYCIQRLVLQKLVDEQLIPQVCLESFDLMVQGQYLPGRVFQNKGITNPIKFAKGTPMGGDGLFMLASLTHELIVRMIQRQTGIRRPFFIQGDDAIIKNDIVFTRYKYIMEQLGCVINQSKTMKSYRACEYCGFINTTDVSVPMMKVHDRITMNPLDLVSPRAVQAFGIQRLMDVLPTVRPEVIIQLKVLGLLPITDQEDTLIEAQALAKALIQYEKVVSENITSYHNTRMYSIKNTYPIFSIDDTTLSRLITHQDRATSHQQYLNKMEMMKHYRSKLLSDPKCDIFLYANLVNHLYEDIMSHHKDVIHHISVKDSDIPAGRPSTSVEESHVSLSIADKAIRNIEQRHTIFNTMTEQVQEVPNETTCIYPE